ncbi:hypothetical protein HX859_30570, partial [Pseudomonas gingeri]|nr:hypothetical protein [Pseudomonas gingeri]
MVLRTQAPTVNATPPTAAIELAVRTPGAVENAQVAVAPPGFTARAAQAASGM